MWVAVVALILQLAAISSAPAQSSAGSSMLSGARLLNACRDLEAQRTDAPGEDVALCLGIVDTVATLFDQDKFCLPRPITIAQLVRVNIRYMEQNPATQHYKLSVLTIIALREAYPCASQRSR